MGEGATNIAGKLNEKLSKMPNSNEGGGGANRLAGPTSQVPTTADPTDNIYRALEEIQDRVGGVPIIRPERGKLANWKG